MIDNSEIEPVAETESVVKTEAKPEVNPAKKVPEKANEPVVDHRHDVAPGGGNPMAHPPSPTTTATTPPPPPDKAKL